MFDVALTQTTNMTEADFLLHKMLLLYPPTSLVFCQLVGAAVNINLADLCQKKAAKGQTRPNSAKEHRVKGNADNPRISWTSHALLLCFLCRLKKNKHQKPSGASPIRPRTPSHTKYMAANACGPPRRSAGHALRTAPLHISLLMAHRALETTTHGIPRLPSASPRIH